jgi:hypothetical protein
MDYYEVPADVLEDDEECIVWARRSLVIAAKPKRRVRQAKPR